MKKFIVVYKGGTCGSMVSQLLHYYMISPLNMLVMDSSKGHAHNINTNNCQSNPNHLAWDLDFIIKFKQESPNNSVITIVFDESDFLTMAKFEFGKIEQPKIETNLNDYIAEVKQELASSTSINCTEHITEFLRELEAYNTTCDTKKLQQSYIKSYLGTGLATEWLKQINYDVVDLVIDFKTILGQTDKDLHQIIADYAGKPKMQEVDDFINQYREINNRLYLNGM